ncbi:hypothetical protein FQN54_007736 [Arachnomyces sp. PD_36]|nr:hypothetical protein FQN54_007736 [Arachnomyces sp. PD_36]
MRDARLALLLALGFQEFQHATALDNGLAVTPQMGWNTWNSFGCDLNEEVILDTVDKIVKLGFRDLGYEYIVLDDCWSDGRNSSGYLQPNMEKFPNGIEGVVQKIHGAGLKAGIYSSAGTMTCARYEGSLGYEEKDAELWASWGIDYLKYDNCYNEGNEGTPALSFKRYNKMGQALNATDRPILYSMCNWGVDGPWNFAPTIANSWRITGDLFNVYDRDDPACPCAELDGLACKLPGYHCSMMNVVNKAAYMPSKGSPSAWNDLDMLHVGNGGLTDTEAVAHFSLWAALKSPLMMSNIMKKIDARTLSILQNPAVLAVSQDPLGTSAVRRSRQYVDDVNRFGKGEIQTFTGPLAGGDQLVLFLNAATNPRTMSVSLEDIFWDFGPSGTADQIHQAWDVYDLWGSRLDDETANKIIDGTIAPIGPGGFDITAQGGPGKVFSQTPPRTSKALMGTFVETVEAEGTVSAEVEPHGVAMLRLRAQEGS